MTMPKLKQSMSNLKNALDRLEDAVQRETTDKLLIDGTIQRFEFTIELFWKTLKRFLEEDGVEATTPRSTLKEAYKANWIHNEEIWLKMLKDRNSTSHVYDEKLAERIYKNIKQYYPIMKETYLFLQQKINDEEGN
ncbi:MAG TPA: nucleotidyltransferase [Bacillus bacterium]|nr:nucleotidyltransferase [Bacillus sp. (in: firmicutes)]